MSGARRDARTAQRAGPDAAADVVGGEHGRVGAHEHVRADAVPARRVVQDCARVGGRASEGR
eukprot:8226906-Alexandrium_andersonii.AAC.1